MHVHILIRFDTDSSVDTPILWVLICLIPNIVSLSGQTLKVWPACSCVLGTIPDMMLAISLLKCIAKNALKLKKNVKIANKANKIIRI